MATETKIEYRIKKEDHLAHVIIDSYNIVEDNYTNHKIVNRHIQRWAHSYMSNILSDAMYNYDDKIELNISENGLKAYITVNGETRYFIHAIPIEIYDMEYRVYRDYGITCIDNKFVLSHIPSGRVIHIINKDDRSLDNQYNHIYDYIDRCCLDLYD